MSDFSNEWQGLALRLLAQCATQQHELPVRALSSPPKPCSLAALTERKIDTLYYLQYESAASAQSLYDKVWKAQRAALQEVVAAFSASDVVPIVVKGAEFINRFFCGRSIGLMNDIDVLIQRPHLGCAKRVLHEQGFSQSYFAKEQMALVERDVSDIATIEAAHYELAPFCRLDELDLSDDELAIAAGRLGHPLWIIDGVAHAVVEFDIHHGLASDIESERFFQHLIPSSWPGASTLDLGDHLWFTTSRYYNEVAYQGKRSLRDFAYLIALCRSNPDWNKVVRAAHDYRLYPSLFYFLMFVEQLTGQVPSDVLRETNPLTRERLRDAGWQLGPLFDFIEPIPLKHDRI